MMNRSTIIASLIVCFVLIGCGRKSSKSDEELHRSVFVQMMHLRECIMKYRAQFSKEPDSLEEVERFVGESLRCGLVNGEKLVWRMNTKSNDLNDWFVAAPIGTEHDGMKGVWVMTKGLSLQVWPRKAISTKSEADSKKDAK